ncbi:hypothetical protein [Corynebacterium macclintockiae]
MKYSESPDSDRGRASGGAPLSRGEALDAEAPMLLVWGKLWG